MDESPASSAISYVVMWGSRSTPTWTDMSSLLPVSLNIWYLFIGQPLTTLGVAQSIVKEVSVEDAYVGAEKLDGDKHA